MKRVDDKLFYHFKENRAKSLRNLKIPFSLLSFLNFVRGNLLELPSQAALVAFLASRADTIDEARSEYEEPMAKPRAVDIACCMKIGIISKGQCSSQTGIRFTR